MLIFIDSGVGISPATVWECRECECQFGFSFTDKKNEEKDPRFCPGCGISAEKPK